MWMCSEEMLFTWVPVSTCCQDAPWMACVVLTWHPLHADVCCGMCPCELAPAACRCVPWHVRCAPACCSTTLCNCLTACALCADARACGIHSCWVACNATAPPLAARADLGWCCHGLVVCSCTMELMEPARLSLGLLCGSTISSRVETLITVRCSAALYG
jgi:hypothetical protein